MAEESVQRTDDSTSVGKIAIIIAVVIVALIIISILAFSGIFSSGQALPPTSPDIQGTPAP